jgi:hypothetical protein
MARADAETGGVFAAARTASLCRDAAQNLDALSSVCVGAKAAEFFAEEPWHAANSS